MADYKVPGQYEYSKGFFLKMPLYPPSSAEKMKTFPFEDGDIVVATYPKCGTTWACQILTLLLNDGNEESEAMKVDITKRTPYMELHLNPQEPAIVDVLAKTPAPRIVRTHMPPEIFKQGLEAGKGKFIVVTRNPKDCLVSYYNFYCAMSTLGNFPGTFADFFELFRAKGLMHGDWLDYNLGWWHERHRDNVLFLKYEDMKRDPRAAILEIASFCGKRDLPDDVIHKVVEATSFDSMKTNPTANMSSFPKFVFDTSKSSFMRKGIVGDWMNVFTEEQSDYVDEHYTAPAAKQGLTFDFPLSDN